MFYHVLDSNMFMAAAAYITLASISGASKRENREVKDKTEFTIYFFGNFSDSFSNSDGEVLDFHGQRHCQGHHPESD